MIIETGKLADAVRTVLPATRARHLPVLSRVRIEADGAQLLLSATDLDLSIGTTIEASGACGPVVVPAALLSTWLEGAAGEVSLELVDNDLSLESESGNLRLRTLPAEDFPKIETAHLDTIELDAEQARRLASITFAASKDGARPILNGIGISDGWAACTDSYRLAAVALDLEPTAIIPARVVDLAVKAGGSVMLRLDDRRVTITDGTTEWTSRMIEGQFPNWRNLVGKPTTTVTLDRERTITALERVLVLAEGIETPVRISPEGDGLVFSIVSRDVGEVTETVTGGENLGATYGFRPRLLLDLLRWRDEAKIELGVTDSLHPVSVGSLEAGEVGLVMPVRL